MSAAKPFALPPLPTPAQRSTPAPEAVETFARREASRLRRKAPGRRFAVYVPHDLAKRLRVRCAEDDRSLSDAVSQALEAWLRA